MADDKNKPDQEQLGMMDYAFRQGMRDKQDTDPEAKAWVALDNKADNLEQSIARNERKLEERPNRLIDLHRDLEEARIDRDHYSLDNPRPGAFQTEDRKAWDKEYQALDTSVSDYQKDYSKALEQSTPEQIGALQERIAERREALVKTMEERQGIAQLPSEQANARKQERQADAGLEDEWDPSQRNTNKQSIGPSAQMHEFDQQQGGTFADRLTAQREASQQQDQGDQGSQGKAGDGQIAGRRLQPNFAAYATTLEDQQKWDQLAEDQRTLHLQHGRPATDAEVVALETQRAQQQAAQQQQSPEAMAPKQEVAQNLAADVPTGSMADRLAARREQQAPQAQASDSAIEGQGQAQKAEATQAPQAPKQEQPKQEQEAPTAKQEQGAKPELTGTSTVAQRQEAAQSAPKPEAKQEQSQTQEHSQQRTRGQGMGM